MTQTLNLPKLACAHCQRLQRELAETREALRLQTQRAHQAERDRREALLMAKTGAEVGCEHCYDVVETLREKVRVAA